jgi:glycosyltransferase involved in cell wall biosynthesis
VLAKTLSLPLDNLIHPTEIPEAQWSWDKFMANREKKIIQLGWWLRKLHAIFQLPESDYRKVFLKVNNEDYLNALIEKEKQLLLAAGEFRPGMYDTAETVSYLPNQKYDEWLSENIGFVYLYDSSANNAVIECMARNTPLLVNPIPAVKEYLGEGYPFYYENFEEAIAKASDLDTVRKTYEYLRKNPIKKKLTGEYFRKSLVRSPIMKKVHRMAS